ncbi:MAG: MFS transporter [Actinomycetota bacterium]
MAETRSSLFRNSGFLKLWAGQAASFIGDAVAMVALVILVAEITGEAAAVGGVLLVRLVPTLASPFAGVVADRMDRRLLLVTGDLVRAILALGLVFARDLPIVYALVFGMGVARTFFNPTIRAAFPSVVGMEHLTRANGIISATFSVSITVGPALGGLLVATVGIEAAFLLDAATFLISAAFLALLPLPRPEREEEAGFFEELKGGLGYLSTARVPLALVIGAFFTVLAVDLTVPAEVFLARETFEVGNTGYGLLVSFWGAGMVAGSTLMAALANRAKLLPVYFAGIFVSAAALAGTGLSPTFAIALGALTIAGIANGIDNVTTDTILQESVPEAFLGRVFSTRFLSYSLAEALAYPAGGLLVDATGPRSTYLTAGLGMAAAGLLVLLLATAAPVKKTRGDHTP